MPIRPDLNGQGGSDHRSSVFNSYPDSLQGEDLGHPSVRDDGGQWDWVGELESDLAH
jgi:hypothetical protein